MIPTFPQFKKLELTDREDVEAFTRNYPPYSDFNFTSMWAWDINDEMLLSILNDNLIVLFTDYVTQQKFLSFLGENSALATAHALLAYSKIHNLPPFLKLVPEISVKNLSKDFEVIADRDNFDYIYDVHALATFAGSALERKRTLVNQFTRNHPEARIEIIDISNHATKSAIIELMRRWEQNKISEGKETHVANELSAILRLEEIARDPDLVSMGVFSGNELLAFSIDEIMDNNWALGHFCKADQRHTGVYDFLMQNKSKQFETFGVTLLDYEQDLGILGLRKSKESYGAVSMLKKYRVFDAKMDSQATIDNTFQPANI